MATAIDVALLAPVPAVHLESAKTHGMTNVAFGTDCYDVLRILDEIRGGENGKRWRGRRRVYLCFSHRGS